MARDPSTPDKSDETDADSSIPIDENRAGTKRKRQLVTGAAIGIGSAALVAALLYANRSRKPTREEDKDR